MKRNFSMKGRIFLLLLGLIIVSQIPFAYRRYRLRRLQQAIQTLNSQRTAPPANDYVDYQGVIHVHTSLGGHSTGNFAELIAAARANELNFVIMTEHPQADFNTAAMTLNGNFGSVLFVNGNEVVTSNGDRLLLLGGSDNGAAGTQTTEAVAAAQKATERLSIAAYPTESQTWPTSGVDGVEVYNLFTNTREANRIVLFLDGLWSYRGYPDLMFANFFSRPTQGLSLWDKANAAGNRRLFATAGNDAHANIGLSVNDASGNQWFGIQLDPYERSFRVVRTHILLKKDQGLTRESLLNALRQGHCYISFDLFSDPRGFSFSVAGTVPAIMGDEISIASGMQLRADAPLACRFVLFKDGVPSIEKSGASVEFPVDAPGTYRVEAYLESLPAPIQGQPWIISNPIYIRPQAPTVQ